MAHPSPDIPLARPGPITDEMLDQLIRHAGDLQAGACTHEGATLLIYTVGPALEELRARRQAMAHIGRVAAAGAKVTVLRERG